jgi:hypothetical protein
MLAMMTAADGVIRMSSGANETRSTASQYAQQRPTAWFRARHGGVASEGNEVGRYRQHLGQT